MPRVMASGCPPAPTREVGNAERRAARLGRAAVASSPRSHDTGSPCGAMQAVGRTRRSRQLAV